MPHSKIKILIVEDEVIPALDLKLSLKRSNFNVIGIARDENHLREIMKEITPDLILLDVNLPGGMSGLEIARELIKMDIKIIFITGLTDLDTLKKIKELNSQLFSKPFVYEALKAGIKETFNINSECNSHSG